jgi:hypothetical protein
MRRENKGSPFDGWLHEEGLYEEVSAAAIKRVLARQSEQAVKEKRPRKNLCNGAARPEPRLAGRRTFR